MAVEQKTHIFLRVFTGAFYGLITGSKKWGPKSAIENTGFVRDKYGFVRDKYGFFIKNLSFFYEKHKKS